MKKGLIAVLIAANLLMLAIDILTIPPNLRSAATGKKPRPRPRKALASLRQRKQVTSPSGMSANASS